MTDKAESIKSAFRPPSALVQRALDWIFEQPEALDYARLYGPNKEDLTPEQIAEIVARRRTGPVDTW